MERRGRVASFFRHRRYERLDMPHRTAHGDPWKSEEAYPEVFWWQNVWRALVSVLPVPGIGSYYPHLYLALAAEYFFRSLTFVVLGVFVWSLFVELPIYFLLNWVSLLPDDRGLWKQFVVYHKRNPTPDQIESALGFKDKYEKPSKGEYYAVFVGRSSGLGPWGGYRVREDMLLEAGHNRIKEVYGITYHKRDFSGYVLWAILLDILVGLGGAAIAWYVRISFGLDSFRDSADGALVGEYIGLFVLIAHLAVYWGWIFTPVAFGYIFILGAVNSNQDVFSWTPYLVFFGITAYYWIVFFRNPLPMWLRSPWKSTSRNEDAPALMEEVVTPHRREPMEEHHFLEERGTRRRPGATERVIPEEVLETAAATASVETYSWSWWVFSSTNYDTYGFNAWFGSMLLLIIVAIIALST